MEGSFEGLPRDDGRLYGDLVERAVAESGRAVDVAAARSVSRAPDPAATEAVVRAQNANTAAILAVAERLDVLIGCLFDERRPIAVFEQEPPEDDHGADD